MADFASAIVVPLASPIPPAATLNMYVATAILFGARAFNFRMIPVEAGVNRSIEKYVTPWSGACRPRRPTSVPSHQSSGDATQQTIVQMHNSPDRECYFASIAYSATLIRKVAAGLVRRSSFR